MSDVTATFITIFAISAAFLVGGIVYLDKEYPCTIVDKYEYQGRHAFLYAVHVDEKEIKNQEQQVGKQEWETLSIGATRKCKLNSNHDPNSSTNFATGVAAGYLMSSGTVKR